MPISQIAISNFSEPIKCHSDYKDLNEIFELKCWLEGVYIDQALLNGTIGTDITRWGVGSTKVYQNRTYINQNYYQWVVPILLLQALLLYLPWAFWSFFEGRLMEKLVNKTGKTLAAPRSTFTIYFTSRFVRHHR